jgi:hypothetical protein
MMKLRERLRRIRREWKTGPAIPLDVDQIRGELEGLKFGIRCMMAMGGYKLKPEGMNDEELKKKADSTTMLLANLHLMVRCAEEVIVRHGLGLEYQAQLTKIGEGLNAAVSEQVHNRDQLAAMQALLKAGKNGKDHAIQEAVEPGTEGSVGPEGIRDHSEGGAEPG